MKKNTEADIQKVMSSNVQLSAFYFCATGLLILTLGFFSNSNDIELLERILYLIIFLMVIHSALRVRKVEWQFKSGKAVLPIAMIFLTILGVGSIENHGKGINELKNFLWLGFGPEILIFSIILAFFFPKVFLNQTKNKVLTSMRAIISLIVISVSMIAFYQDRKSLIDDYTSEYLINELLAPVVGRVPFYDFIPQYQGFFGFFFIPFRFSAFQ
jgi:hypothetical protein